MRKILLILLLLLLPVAAAQSDATGESSILVLGDSLSAAYGIPAEQGWVGLLRQRLEEHGLDYRVANASISGDTSAGGLRRLPTLLDRHRPSILILELGGNDGLRGIDLAQTRLNLSRMVDIGRDSGSRVLLLGMLLPPNFGKAFTEKFRQMYADLAREKGIAVVPFFLDGVADRPEWMQRDGIHPNVEGQPRMLENVWEILEPMLR